MRLLSDLWLDQEDAHDRIEARLRAHDLAPATATQLHSFVDCGYLRLTLDLDDAFFAAFDADVERAWRERPADLAISPPGPEGPLAFRDYDGKVRERGYRIPDFHSHSAAARDLYLNPTIFAMIELVFDAPAIAFQSLYFEYGSFQGLHRDPMFVVADPPSHLLASWTALEDIGPESGPLAYVPGSHRLDWFEFEPGTVVRRPSAPPERAAEWSHWVERTVAETPAEGLTCARGETFIWHAGLLHGGMPILDPAATRKSFVVHYSTAAHYRARTASMRVRDGDAWTTVQRTTETQLTSAGTRGLASPRALQSR